MKFKFLLLFLLVPHLACAYYAHHPCCSRLQPCGWWGSADYLLIWRKHRFFPPLVTTSSALVPPTLSDPSTRILFGGDELGGAPKSGAKGDFGVWISRCLGVGTGFLTVGENEVNFKSDGAANGLPILGQPFFNTSAGTQDVSLISFPNLALNGHIDIETVNRFWFYDLYLRYRFLSSERFKFDLLGGFLYNQMQDKLNINSHTTIPVAIPTLIAVSDNFLCSNNFVAGLVGLYAEWRSCSWAFTLTGKVGIGDMEKIVNISGTTTTSAGGIPIVTRGGLLAQPSNIGKHINHKFEVVPQIEANLQLKIFPHMWLTVGYTYLFWPAVVLAGEQVNLDINPTQVPGPEIGPLAPLFEENLKTFWAQGLTAGLYFCY